METFNAIGGVCRTKDLTRAGWRQIDLRQAVSTQQLTRLRVGWYAQPGADEKVVRAVRAGGSLGCASAIAFHGGWDVTGNRVHVRTDHNRTGRPCSGLAICRSPDDRDDHAPECPVDDLEVALRCAWRCLESDDFIAVCDSLAHRELATPDDIRSWLGPLGGVDDRLELMDTAESGTETLVRLRLRRLGIRLRTQVVIPGVGRVDMLIGKKLVVEVDSRAHHTGEERYRSDRERDLRLMALGYRVIRVTYEQVMFDWPSTEILLRQAIRRHGR